MSKNFEQRLYEGNYWEKGKECLNLHDINKPPDRNTFLKNSTICKHISQIQ